MSQATPGDRDWDRVTFRPCDTSSILAQVVEHGSQPSMSEAIRHALRQTYGAQGGDQA